MQDAPEVTWSRPSACWSWAAPLHERCYATRYGASRGPAHRLKVSGPSIAVFDCRRRSAPSRPCRAPGWRGCRSPWPSSRGISGGGPAGNQDVDGQGQQEKRSAPTEAPAPPAAQQGKQREGRRPARMAGTDQRGWLIGRYRRHLKSSADRLGALGSSDRSSARTWESVAVRTHTARRSQPAFSSRKARLSALNRASLRSARTKALSSGPASSGVIAIVRDVCRRTASSSGWSVRRRQAA